MFSRLSFQSPEGIQPLCAEVWHREEYRDDYRREQLQVVGIQPQPEDDNDDRVVYHAADDRKGQRTEEIQMLAEYRAGNNLADYDGGKADDDRAAAHVDIRRALKLCEQRAGEGDKTVRKHEAKYNVRRAPSCG